MTRETVAAVAFLDDPASRFAVTTERAALTGLAVDVTFPLGFTASLHCRVTP